MIYGQPITLGGKKAEGEISITDNGTYDVTKYASANVNVQSAPVLLWTNASPTSTFAAQTLTFGGSYGGYIIYSRYQNTQGDYCYSYVPADGSTQYEAVLYDVSTYNNPGRRTFQGSVNSLVISAGLYGSTNNNKYAIPIKIWGVKGAL